MYDTNVHLPLIQLNLETVMYVQIYIQQSFSLPSITEKWETRPTCIEARLKHQRKPNQMWEVD